MGQHCSRVCGFASSLHDPLSTFVSQHANLWTTSGRLAATSWSVSRNCQIAFVLVLLAESKHRGTYSHTRGCALRLLPCARLGAWSKARWRVVFPLFFCKDCSRSSGPVAVNEIDSKLVFPAGVCCCCRWFAKIRFLLSLNIAGNMELYCRFLLSILG